MPPYFPDLSRLVSSRLSPRLCAGVVALGLLAGFMPVAMAEKSDRLAPLNFAADAAHVDEARKLNVLTGNVEITKGSMALRAGRVEIQQNANGTQNATATGGPGGRAFFRQKRDGVDEIIEGEAEKIVYQGRDDTVHFYGRAIMRRVTAGRATDEVTGQVIVYDNKTSIFQAQGSPASTGGKGRVRGVITPRQNNEASEP